MFPENRKGETLARMRRLKRGHRAAAASASGSGLSKGQTASSRELEVSQAKIAQRGPKHWITFEGSCHHRSTHFSSQKQQAEAHNKCRHAQHYCEQRLFPLMFQIVLHELVGMAPALGGRLGPWAVPQYKCIP